MPISTAYLEAKKKVVPYELKEGESKKGKKYTYPLFNHNFGTSEIVLRNILENITELGFTKNTALDFIAQKTGVPRNRLKNQFIEGRIPVTLWELIYYTSVIGYEIHTSKSGFELRLVDESRYSYSAEMGRLVLRSTRLPRFHININLEDYYDFEVDFSQERSVLTSNKYKCIREFNKLMTWYFIDEAKNKKLPYDDTKMRAIFRQKYFNGEMRNTAKEVVYK